MSKVNESNQKNLEIRKSIIIEASPQVIFDAITKPEEITRWFSDQATVEPRVGGMIKLTTLSEKHPEYKLDKDYITEGVIKEFVPNKKLSYSWKYHDMPDFPETMVVWELEEIESDKTRLKLTHLGFTGQEKGLTSFDSHDQGWTEMLDKLAKYCKKDN